MKRLYTYKFRTPKARTKVVFYIKLPVVLRSMISAAIKRITDLHLLDFGDDSLDKLVMDRFLYKQSTGGNAVLSLVEEH